MLGTLVGRKTSDQPTDGGWSEVPELPKGVPGLPFGAAGGWGGLLLSLVRSTTQ